MSKSEDSNNISVDYIEKLENKIKSLEEKIVVRKEIEEALIETEKNLRAILENNADGILIVDTDGVVLYVNPAAEELFNRRKKDFIGFPLGYPLMGDQNELSLIIKQGKEYIDVESRIVSVVWEGKAAYQLAVRDITKIKQTKRELREAKEKAEENYEKFSKLYNKVADAIFIYDPDTYEIIEANQATSDIYGYSHDELIGMSCLKFSAEVDKSTEVAKRTKKEEKVFVNLRHHKKKDGTDLYVQILNYKILFGGKEVFYAVCHDTTNLRKHEQEIIAAKEAAEARAIELKEQQVLFETMFNTIKEGVVITNTDREILIANNGMLTTFGYNPAELKGQKTAILYANEDNFAEAGKQVFNKDANPKNKEYLTYYKRKDNTIFPGETFGAKLYNNKNEWIGNIGIMRDVSEREKFIDELQKAKEIVEENEALLRDAQRIANIGNWTLDLKTGKVEMSEEMLNLIGLKDRNEALNVSNHEKYYTPESWQRFNKAYETIINTGKKYEIELEFSDKNAKYRYASARGEAINDKNGKIVGIKGTLQDITNRKNLEKSLQEREEFLNRTGEIAKVGGWQLVDNFTRVEWTKTTGEIHELPDGVYPTLEEAINYYHPNERDKVSKAVSEAIEKGKPYDFRTRFITAKGNLRWVRIIGRPEMMKGKVYRLSGTFHDITEQKEYEQKLEESSQYLENLNNSLVDVVFTVEPKNRKIKYTNKAVGDVFGYSPEECKGIRTLFLYKDKKEYTEFGEKLKSTITNNKDFIKTEQWLKRKNGEFFNAEITTSFIKQEGEIIEILSVVRNVSEKVKYRNELIKAKEKAEQSEQKFRTLYNELQEGVTLTHKGMITDINDFMVKKLGFQHKDELIGKSLLDFMTEESKEIAINEIKKLHSENTIYSQSELVFKSKNGEEIIVSMNGTTVELAGKKYGLGVHHDITERIKFEKDLLEAKEKAEESDRLKSAFLANMSHEIRTPMNGIMGFTNLLKEPGLSGDEQQEFIKIIEKSGERLLNTIQDIVDISKIESGQVTIVYSECNLNNMVEELYKFFLPEAKAKGLELSYISKLPAKYAVVKSDKNKLESIFTNLIKNAIKYTLKGQIDFGFYINEKGRPAEIEFFVKDTGIGIPENRLEAIFDRFVQADIEDTRVFEGSGLGLSITKAYVEMLGGKIWLTSKENEGSQFYFTIPFEGIVNENQNEVLKDAADTNISKNQLKVLIVEDDKNSVKYLKIVLKDYIKDSLFAETGIEAVRLCKENPDINIILMDMKMPEMDGFEATRLIREFNKNIYIIGQSAYAQIGDRERCLEAGCNDYIAKPFKKTEVLALISKYIK